MRERASVRHGVWCAAALLALLPFGLPQAADPASAATDQSAEEQDPLDKEMERISKLLANSEMRLRTGVRGIEQRSAAPTNPPTPGRQCCQSNLEDVDKSLQKMRRELQATGTCFEQRRDRDGIRRVTEVLQRMRALDQALRQFADAPTPAGASDRQVTVRRAYLSLLDGLEEFPECSVSPPTD